MAKYSLILLAMIAFGTPACTSSTGGEQKAATGTPANKPQSPTTPVVKPAGDEGGAQAGDDDDDDDDEKEQGDGNEGDDENEGDATAGDPKDNASDEYICKFVKAQKSVAAKLSVEVAYLCDQGGLKKLRAQQAGKMVALEDKQDGNLSHFMFAGALQDTGTVPAAQKLSDVFCRDFNEYKSTLGAEAFKDVESITPSNAKSNGCDYEFKGKKILFFQPSFVGKQKVFLNKTKSVAMYASYLVTKGDLVEDNKTLNLVIKTGDKVYAYNIATNVSDTKGFHGQARDGIIAGNEAGLRAFSAAMAKLK